MHPDKVVSLLSSRAIGALLVQNEATQAMIVEHVGNLLDYWEQQNIALDPVEQEAILDSITVSECAIIGTLGGVMVALSEQISELTEALRLANERIAGCTGLHVEEGVRGAAPAWRTPGRW